MGSTNCMLEFWLLGGAVCDFLQGGGGNVEDVRFESREALVWPRGANARI